MSKATFRVTARKRMTIHEAMSSSPFDQFKYERRTWEFDAESELEVRYLWSLAKENRVVTLEGFELEAVMKLNPV